MTARKDPNKGGLDVPARVRNKKITLNDKERYLEGLRAGMTKRQAAEAASHPPESFRKMAVRQPEFAEQIKEAFEIGTDVIEQEAYRRGVEGVEKAIIGKVSPGIDGHLRDDEGNLLYERVYSDRTLEVLLKGRRPEYRENPKVQIDQRSVNLTVEDRSATIDAVAKVLLDAGVTIEATEGITEGSGASFKELPEP